MKQQDHDPETELPNPSKSSRCSWATKRLEKILKHLRILVSWPADASPILIWHSISVDSTKFKIPYRTLAARCVLGSRKNSQHQRVPMLIAPMNEVTGILARLLPFAVSYHLQSHNIVDYEQLMPDLELIDTPGQKA